MDPWWKDQPVPLDLTHVDKARYNTVLALVDFALAKTVLLWLRLNVLSVKDIQLWHLLDPKHSLADDQILNLKTMLAELSQLSVRARMPFLGRVQQFAKAGDAEIRALAMDVFSGVSGWKAWKFVLQFTEDQSESVRTAAVNALIQSAVGSSWLLTHLIFHPSLEVRTQTLRHFCDLDKPLPDSFLYLLTDDQSHDLIVEGLSRLGTTAEASSYLLLSLHENQLLSTELTRKLIAHLSEKSLIHCLLQLPNYSEEHCKQLLAPCVDVNALADGERDGIQWLLQLFWDESTRVGQATDASASSEVFYDSLFRLLRDYWKSDPYLTQRFIASALTTARQEGTWCPQAASYCAASNPEFLIREDVPADVRRKAAGVLYRLRDRLPEFSGQQVREILKSNFCRRRSGQLDLWIIGAVLHYRHRDGLAILKEVFTVNQIATAFLAAPDESAPFFSYPGSTIIRQELLDAIRSMRGPIGAKLDAMLVFVVPADGLTFLNQLDGVQALRVLTELWNLCVQDEFKLTERKTSVATAILINKLSTDQIGTFLRSWLANPTPMSFVVGIEALGRIAREKYSTEQLIEFAKHLEHASLRKLLACVVRTPAFPYGAEIQLAIALTNHKDSIVRDWAIARAPDDSATPPEPAQPAPEMLLERDARVAFTLLESRHADLIETCPESELGKRVECCLKVPVRGLCAALAARNEPLEPQLEVCAAILGSADSVTEIDQQFSRFSSTEPKFLSELDALMVKQWQTMKKLPVAACAWLCRWNAQSEAFADLTMNSSAQLVAQLQQTRTFTSQLFARQFWFAVKVVLNQWRYRDSSHYRDFVDAKLFHEFAVELREENDELAAEMLMGAYQSRLVGESLAAVRNTILESLPEYTTKVRQLLQPWIDSRGIGSVQVTRQKSSSLPQVELQEIERATDLDLLMQWCSSNDRERVIAAAERCISLGGKWLDSMAALLSEDSPPHHSSVIGDTVSLWPEEQLELAEILTRYESLDHDTRFLICVNLAAAGRTGWLNEATQIACVDQTESWFQRDYLERLQKLAPSQQWVAVRLATSPHPYAYQFAVNQLIKFWEQTSWVGKKETQSGDALRRFLDCGSERVRSLRLDAAESLANHSDYYGYPLLLEAASETSLRQGTHLEVFPEPLVLESVETALLAGPTIFSEDKILMLLELNNSSSDLYQAAAINLNESAVSNPVRQRLALKMRKGLSHSKKLQAVAETFAWGIPIARQLTERLFTIQMIGGDDYGYTRLNENKVYINPLPILQRRPSGREIVEGLILHELGHHMYHRGKKESEIWEQADKEGLGRLLNLVSDEHLERNLRAMDRSFGDRLKKLGAYAFRHSTKEVKVRDLLESLNLRAFEVLVDSRMKVARRSYCVRLSTRRVLQQLERTGASFSRFFQAMRLGLGNRHNDPRVAEALKLFGKDFRHSNMKKLYEITVRLREIFGDECQILNCFDQSRICEGEGSQIIIDGDGLTNEDVQSEIKRISNPESMRTGGNHPGRWINVSDKIDFEPITAIQRVNATPSEHAEIVKPILRHANQLRRYLAELGLVMVPQRRRIRGRGLDRAGLTTAILKSDPRILKLREPRYHTDLFIGVAIDCSGSMAHDDNIEKAKMFGALLTETVRGMSTVDLRVFGFTDSVIFDAGSADRPGLAGLHAGGGNNDAAALLHVAQQAQISRRRAKLLVMISDGLPTECSVEALRSLVVVLTQKWKMCCAQVAVQPLEEICFPNYVLLDTSEPAVAVREFGLTIARLIRKSMAQSS